MYIQYPYSTSTEVVPARDFEVERLYRTLNFRDSNIRRMKPAVRNTFRVNMVLGKGYSASYTEATRAQ